MFYVSYTSYLPLFYDKPISNQKRQGAIKAKVRNLPSFKLPWPTPVDVHSLEIVNKAFNSSTKYLQSKMLFSKTSGSPCDSKKSEFQAWSAHSLRMEEIWRPLQAEIVRSVMEGAILERTTSSRLFRRQLGSRYRDIISTFLGGVKLTHFRNDLMNLATKKCKIIIDLKKTF